MNDIMKRECLAKFGGRCAYCGRLRGRTVDHVRPLDRGGCDWPDNLMPACNPCNNAKANMTLEEFRIALYNARFNIMPHKKTILSGPGQQWVKLARYFQDSTVIFWFEKVQTAKGSP